MRRSVDKVVEERSITDLINQGAGADAVGVGLSGHLADRLYPDNSLYKSRA